MAGGHAEEPLLSNHFNYNQRRRQDVFWGVLYASLLAATIVGGIYGVTHRNGSYSRLVQQEALSDPANCPAGGGLGALQRSLAAAEDPSTIDLTDFARKAGKWLAVSAGASFLLGFAFLAAVRLQAKLLVQVTIAMQVALPLAMGVAALAAGQPVGGLIGLGAAALAAFVFWLWRAEIDLCGRLLAVAASALGDNLGLLVFVGGAWLAMLAVSAPLLGFSYFAYQNGDLAPNNARAGRATCTSAEGDPIPCCMWQPNDWVTLYGGLAGLTALWTTFLFFQLRVFVISGTVAQWYFAPPGVAATRGATLRSLRHGLGPSFGSLCFGSAVLTAINLARQAVEKAREQRNGQNLIVCLLAACANCAMALLEYLTKFATVRMAITGEAFLAASRSVTDLLAHNFLKAYGVWWFPPLVLNTACALLALAWGGAIYLASWSAWHTQPTGSQEAALLAFLAGLVALIVLSFLASVLLNIVDAVFICYALDRDTQAVTKPAVHEVFAQVPVGVAVVQPDGEVSYGAPQQHTGAYVPPSHAAATRAYDSSAHV